MLKLNFLNVFSKVAIWVAIPSSAVFIYLLWRQNKEPEDAHAETILRTRQTYIEIKVPADCVGAIIGSEGSNIKEIQKNTGAKISFIKTNIENDKEEERVLVIRGSIVNAQKAEIEIRRLIAERPIPITQEMMVPKECCGRIIGRSGANIKAMCRISGCKISLSKEPIFGADNLVYNKVLLNGSMEQILHAKELVSEKVKEEEIFRKKKASNENLKNQRMISSRSLQEVVPKEIYQFSTQKLETMTIPENETFFEIYVSAVANPHAFWIQILNQDASKLDQLVDDMSEFYNDRKCDPDLYVKNCKVGDMICVQHNAKGWYRCEVKGFRNYETNNNDDDYEIDVYYVDFGDSAFIKRYEARKLLSKFNELPCYATQCSLNGVEADGEWSNKAVEFFEDISYSCQWKTLNAKFVGFKEDYGMKIPIIDIYDPKKDLDIATQLIQSGHAIESNIITQSF